MSASRFAVIARISRFCCFVSFFIPERFDEILNQMIVPPLRGSDLFSPVTQRLRAGLSSAAPTALVLCRN